MARIIRKRDTETAISVGLKVKDQREKRGWTQRELAIKSILDTTSVSRLERGEHAPTIRLLGRIAKAFGVPLKELLP